MIVRNYEALNADDKASVPYKYYIVAKNLIKRKPEHKLANEVKTLVNKKRSWGLVDNIRHINNKGKLTLLTHPNRTYANTRSTKTPNQSDVNQVTEESPLINVGFIQRPLRQIRRKAQRETIFVMEK